MVWSPLHAGLLSGRSGNKPGVDTVIIGARDEAQLGDNLGPPAGSSRARRCLRSTR
jgi:aryl-alcohol dehydrogenase-like predicted oxidoreductase